MTADVITAEPCILCRATARPGEEFCTKCRAKNLECAIATTLSAHVEVEAMLDRQPAPSFMPDMADFRAVLGAMIEWARRAPERGARVEVVERGRSEKMEIHVVTLIERRKRRIGIRQVEREDDRARGTVHVPEELEGQDVIAWFNRGES